MEEAKYKVVVVNFQGKSKPILCHKSNKCSALVALTNFWYLRGPEVVSCYVLRTADQQYLTSQIVASIEKAFFSDQCKKLPIPKEVFVNAARSLHCHASVDPLNTGCSKFKPSAEALLFRILGVTLLHGWVLDPKDQKFSSLMGLSYNNMVELSTLKKQTPSSASVSDVQKVVEEETPAKSFMKSSELQLTAFGLHQLHENVKEGELAVLYAKNEYNLLHKYNGDLFTLATSEDNVMQLPAAMWRKLAVEEEQSFYVTAQFSPMKGQQKEKYKLAIEWFIAKLSAFDDNKSTKKKKTKLKRILTKELEDMAKDSTYESVLHISDGQAEGSPKSDVAGLASQMSSEEPSAPPTVAPPTIAAKFLDFLIQFRDESDQGGVPYFESIVKEMICTGSFKLYVPFSFLQKHDGNLAIQIQDGYPRNHSELVLSVVAYLIKCDADKSVAAARADLEIQNLPKPKCSTTRPLQIILQDNSSSSITPAPRN